MLSGADLSSVAFDNINGSAAADSIMIWTAEEEHAKREHLHDVTVMDVYDIRMERCKFDHYVLVLLTTGFSSFSGRYASRIDRKGDRFIST